MYYSRIMLNLIIICKLAISPCQETMATEASWRSLYLFAVNMFASKFNAIYSLVMKYCVSPLSRKWNVPLAFFLYRSRQIIFTIKCPQTILMVTKLTMTDRCVRTGFSLPVIEIVRSVSNWKTSHLHKLGGLSFYRWLTTFDKIGEWRRHYFHLQMIDRTK